MKYKIGDVVTVRKDLTVSVRYETEKEDITRLCNREMIKNAGRKATISEVGDIGYRIKFGKTEDRWFWTIGMFEDSDEENYWKTLSQVSLTEHEIELFKEKLDWEMLSEYGTLSEEGWIEHQNKLVQEKFALNKHVPATVYNTLGWDIKWDTLMKGREVDEAFLKEIDMDFFDTITFAKQNPSAKKISNEAWEMVMKRSSDLARVCPYPTKKSHVEYNFLTMEFLDECADEWKEDAWQDIARNQRVTFSFAKKYALRLPNRILETENLFHQLSVDELNEIRKILSEQYEQELKKGFKFNWERLRHKHLFTEEFNKKYLKV